MVLAAQSAVPANVAEHVACNLCGADDSWQLYPSNLTSSAQRQGRLRCTDHQLGEHGRIVRCRLCGFIYTSPREAEKQVLEAYAAVDDPTYVEEEQGRVATFRKSLRLIKRYRPHAGRLLDVGCYTGLFLKVAREEGWMVAGVEPSQWACRMAGQKYGVSVSQGTLSTWQRPEEPFNVVTMWDTLEHYTNPLQELQRAQALLTPGGVLALSTIDIGSPIARLLGRRWWWLMEMHLYYFTRETVSKLLEKAGFEVLGIYPHVRVISLRYLWTRLESIGGGKPARTFAWLGERLKLNDWCVPVVLGDLMTVIARKRA